MNTSLTLTDFAALSPLLVLLAGALIQILLETFAPSKVNRWASSLAASMIVLAFGCAFLAPATDNPLLTPWLKFDPLARLFTLFFLVIGLISTFLAASFFERFKAPKGEYYFLLLSCLIGLILIGASADFLTLFIGLETLSISLYVLTGYMKKWDLSHEGALKYFLMGSLAAAFFLYGIALIYGAVGTTAFDPLLADFKALANPASKALFLSGIALVTLGLCFKAAIVPFHVWAPDVYEGAPMPVTAFMAVGTKVGAFAAFTRVFFVALPHFDPLWNEAIAYLAFPTLIYANFVALRQTQLRRFFAYSGISHAGFLLIPFAAATPDALAILLFYLAVYSLSTLGAFAVLAVLDLRKEGVMLYDLSGLFKRSPWLAASLALCLLTLAGIPPTVGFFAKFALFKIAFQTGYYTLVIVALLTTILSAYYYLRIISLMFADAPQVKEAPKSSLPAALLGLASFAAIVFLSFYPEPLLTLLR